MKKFLAMMLALVMALSLVACGNQAAPDADTDDNSDAPAELTYAVEAGSAGEEVALANGYDVVSVDSQAKALMEVQAGTADAAIIDSLLAGAMVGEGTNYADLAIGPVLNAETGEQYGVGFRKGSDAAAALNEFFRQQWESGALQALAGKYGVQAALIEQK